MISVFVAGTARDCATGLSTRLDRLVSCLQRSGNHQVFLHLIENDSSDDTRAALRNYSADRPHVALTLEDGLVDRFPVREERLAYCRNQLLTQIIAHATDLQALETAIYLPVDLDLDIDWSSLTVPLTDALADVSRGAWNGLFPISTPFYYDIHALRADGWISEDVWDRVRRAERHPISARIPRWATRSLLVGSRQLDALRLTEAGDRIPVRSAFGGFGLYRLRAVVARSYSSSKQQRCEHVEFNAGIKRLAIATELAIAAPAEHLTWRLGPHRAAVFLSALGARTITVPRSSASGVVRPPTADLGDVT